MTRLWTGDYSTGNFNQWGRVATQFADSVSTVYPKDIYSARIISEDRDAGYCARFEVREGDIPPFGGGQRAEAIAAASMANTGTTRWYAFSVKFDPTFPTNHVTLGSGMVLQFHDHPSALYSPPIAFGWPAVGFGEGFRDGYWYLRYAPQSTPDDPVTALFEFPFRLGQWHDIKLQIKWAKDNTGFIRMWWNGQRQTFTTGSDTFTGPTLPPDAGPGAGQTVDGVIIQQGIYRAHDIVPTAIVYHCGCRMASDEASL